MRRAMLTNRTTGGPPFDFGNSTASAGSLSGGNFVVDKNTTSPATGTLTSVTFNSTTSTTISFYTGSLAGSTFTIRGCVDVAATAGGLQTATISLPVQAGDMFAYWAAVTVSGIYDSAAGNLSYVGAGTKPTSGSVTGLGAAAGNIRAHFYGS